MRESAALRLIRKLSYEGLEIKMLDVNLVDTHLMGTNRYYIDRLLPDWQQYYTENVEELFNFADHIVLTNNEPTYLQWVKQYGADKQIITLY